MPVIACPDCSRDVSTLAPVCPHCGRPIAATTAAPPVAQEQTLWRGSPSPVKLAGRIIEIVVVAIVAPLFVNWVAAQVNDLQTSANVRKIGYGITAIVVLLIVARGIFELVRLRSTLYTITNQRVMIERGMLSKSLTEIDLRYVDDIQFFQGLTDRLLGIGNVTIISSDRSTPTYVLHGVKDPRAIREMIRTNSYQVSQRQIFTRAT